MPALDSCPKCQKSPQLCICESLRPLETKIQVLILQHPQEKQEELATALMAHLSLPNSVLKTGLSWANLKGALGKEARPGSWAVLYLGSGIKMEGAKAAGPGLHFVDRKANPTSKPESIEGLLVLDGTWSQAKTLWWRNAWLLKLKRVVLVPSKKSLYGFLRKEPRAECLSTIEAIGEALTALGEKPEVETGLRNIFSELLKKKKGSAKKA